MDIKSIALVTTTITFSVSVNASVFNTLNGVDYEWLELTATQGLSRDQVEAQIAVATPGDTLYGYEYASRALVEDLLLSYASWDGIDHYHGDSKVVTGVASLIDDFGALYTNAGNGSNTQYYTGDGYSVQYDSYRYFNGLYGGPNECGIDITCHAHIIVYADNAGNNTMAYQQGPYGWDSSVSNPTAIFAASVDRYAGSFLVKASVVPVPAAVWLFGSGLLGLIGIARRKKT